MAEKKANFKPTEEEKEQFDATVAAEEERLLNELRKTGELPPPVPDAPAIPAKKGLIEPMAFRKETTDMALDILIRLNGKLTGEEVTVSSGNIKMIGYIDPEGVIQIKWIGVVRVS